MNFYSIKRKIIAGALVLMSITNLIMPLSSQALDYGNSIGTNAALGSPLLNEDSWGSDEWNPWEMVAFGNFLSNFPVPFVDDYFTTFQSGKGGSDGRGLAALQFSTASDTQAMRVMQNLLSLAIKDQSEQLANIKVRYHVIDSSLNDSLGPLTSDDGVDATLKDLLMEFSEDSGDPDKPGVYDVEFETIMNTGFDSTVQIQYANSMVLPEFYITTGSGNTPKTVLDFKDGYDIQIFATSLSRACSTKWKSDVAKVIKDNKDAPLGLDAYGNICALIDGRNVIVLPASANQHLTKEKQYNFLTSTFLLDNYINKSGTGLLESLLSAQAGIIRIFREGGGLVNYRSGGTLTYTTLEDSLTGKVLMYNDSDTALFDYIKSNVKSGKTQSQIVTELKFGFDGFSRGKALYDLANVSISNESMSAPFKMEVIGGESENSWSQDIFGYGSTADSTTIEEINKINRAANIVANYYPTSTNVKLLNKIYGNPSESQLFKERTYYAAGTQADHSILGYVNFAMQYANEKKEFDVADDIFGVPTQEEFRDNLRKANSMYELNNAVYTSLPVPNNLPILKQSNINGLYKHWLVYESGYKKGKNFTSENINNATIDDILSDRWLMKIKTNLSLSGELDYYTSAMFRVAGIYEMNAAMQTASNVLNVREGTEFASYTPWIYLTYLDWYGIMDGGSNFDPDVFRGDILSRTGEVIGEGAITDPEVKKDMIVDYTFKLLDPDSGGEYRTELLNSFVGEFLQDQYSKSVFGVSTSTISSKISTTNGEGFLKLNTLAENFFTEWAISLYTTNFLVILGLLLLISVVGGIITGKGLGHIIQSVLVIASLMTLSPSVGDIAPFICNKVVQKMFEENMTYWAISEGVDSAKIDAQYSSGSDFDSEVNKFIRMLNMSQLDKTIMIKNDISKKVVETLNDIDYNKLQRMQTTKWLFPMLIRQISADDGSADYVYTTLNDMYRNFDNVYWYYRFSNTGGDKVLLDMQNTQSESANIASDAGIGYAYSSGSTSGNTTKEDDILTLSDKQSIFAGYRNTRGEANTNTIDYHSLSRSSNNDENNVHNTFYLLNFGTKLTVPNPLELNEIKSDTELTKNGLTAEVWDKYGEIISSNGSALGFVEGFKTIAEDYIIPKASDFNSYEDPVYQSFGYLWATENPGQYFYHTVRDTFGADLSVGGLIYELQGFYAPIIAEDGVTVINENAHHTFMRDASNGRIRDFLDMEELFTNVIPYLYNVQVIAGGSDGDNGAFGNELLGESYPIYEANSKAWLFRCNWATKLVESRMMNRKDSIGYVDESGNKLKADIVGGLHPSNYEMYRPMVFSEAQMYTMGLTEADLSYVENLILKVNKNVEKDWLMLINFANTKGMKAKVLYRQMAVDAMLEFNRVFSQATGNGISTAHSLYPITLDLRNISFDAVAKLVIASGGNGGMSIYQSAMETTLANGDLLVAILLYIDAALCSVVIPLIRDFGMAVVFFLLIFELFSGVIASKKNKTKLLLGALFIYIKYLVSTVLFYGVFYFLITVSSPDAVLSSQKISSNSSLMIGGMFVVILADILLYGFFLIKYIIKFTWDNKEDMGFEASMSMLSTVGTKITGAVGGVKSSISDLRMDLPANKTEISNKKNNPVHVEGATGSDKSEGESHIEKKDKAARHKSSQSGWQTDSVRDNTSRNDKEFIKDAIEKGRKAQEGASKTEKSEKK